MSVDLVGIEVESCQSSMYILHSIGHTSWYVDLRVY